MRRPLHTLKPLIPILLLAALLSGCAGMAGSASNPRPPLERLARSAAEALAEALPAGGDTTLQMVPTQADDAFGARAGARLGDALTRALLARPNGPQLITAPDGLDGLSQLPADQWLLTSRLRAPSAALQLPDRQLLPWQLSLALYRSGRATPFWQRTLEGVLERRDLQTLNTESASNDG